MTFTTAYTWGKALADVAGRGIASGNEGSGGQNPRNFKAEYGPSGFDRTHIFTSSYVYDLPILKNRADFAGKALGGWTFSGMTVLESGFAFSPGIVGAVGLAQRPDCVGGVSGPKSLTQWFNTAAFARPGFGFFGNCGTGMIRGPGENAWNWALYKTFPIKERMKLQFRSEFFNIWNHPSFDAISASLGAGDFGHVTHALDPRILEFSLRLQF